MKKEYEKLLTRIDSLIAERSKHPQYYIKSLEHLRDGIKPLYAEHVRETHFNNNGTSVQYNPAEVQS